MAGASLLSPVCEQEARNEKIPKAATHNWRGHRRGRRCLRHHVGRHRGPRWRRDEQCRNANHAKRSAPRGYRHLEAAHFNEDHSRSLSRLRKDSQVIFASLFRELLQLGHIELGRRLEALLNALHRVATAAVGSKDLAPFGAVLGLAEADVVCRQTFLLVRPVCARGVF
jgi:hypothetical protein